MKRRKSLGKRDGVSPGHNHVVGEGAVDELAWNVPCWIERLVATPVITAHHGVDDHRRAVLERAGRVVAEDQWELDPFGMPADAAQREEIVAIQAGVTYF